MALACDVLAPVHEATAALDGWVSIEVSPAVAHDAVATVEEAERLLREVDRPNAYIKIPATKAGVTAIREATSRGISVNVTLIFSLTRYREVIDAYLDGLEAATRAGIELSSIHSVASFFVSRVDVEVDRRLDALGTPQAQQLRGRVAIANARLAYDEFTRAFGTGRGAALVAEGAHPQRPLWASTGVKDPTQPDTRYVVELVARDVVNTMPEKTLEAVADHAELRGDTITAEIAALAPGARCAGRSRHLVRRRHRHARAGGDREVHRILGAIARCRHRCPGCTMSTVSGVMAPTAMMAPTATMAPTAAIDLAAAETAVAHLLTALGQDVASARLRATPGRAAAALLGMITSPGAPTVTLMPTEGYRGLVLVRDIPFQSVCEHHLLPFRGRAHLGFLPGEHLAGISALPRAVEHFAHGLQLQERLTEQLREWLELELNPRGAGVVVEAEHLCMSFRGVGTAETHLVTSSFTGGLADDLAARSAFFGPGSAQSAPNVPKGCHD